MNPLRIGTPEQMATVRQMMLSSGYTEAAVCERYAFENLGRFQALREGRSSGPDIPDRMELLVRLFLDSEPVDRTTVRSFLEAGEIEALEATGLLASNPEDASQYHGTMLLYEVSGFAIVSDWIKKSLTQVAEDAVFPAITPQTLQFLSMLPSSPCEALLDIGTGSGIAALLGSRCANHVWATDITRRSVEFANFNVALNGVSHVTVLEGSLYEPVAGKTFDRIVAHPPYAPSLQPTQVYKDGGEDGEQITRGIIGNAAAHLRPGGRLYVVCMATDRKGKRVGERIREMIGPAQAEFDVFVGAREIFQPTEFYFQQALQGRASIDEVVQRHEVFSRLEIEHLAKCVIVIQRITGPRPVFTVRKQMGKDTRSDGVEAAIALEMAVLSPGWLDGLWDARPKAPADLRLKLVNRIEDGRWVTADCAAEVMSPFFLRARCPSWAGAMLARADGSLTLREHFQFFVDGGIFPAEGAADGFIEFAGTFVRGGLLEV